MSSEVNVFSRMRDLFPLPQVYVGTVLEIHPDDTSTVQIPGAGTVDYAGNIITGSLMRPRGATVPVGKRAFVRAGVIETQAPDGDILDVEVGVVVLKPPPTPDTGTGDEIGFLTSRSDPASDPSGTESGTALFPIGFSNILRAGVVNPHGTPFTWNVTWEPLGGDFSFQPTWYVYEIDAGDVNYVDGGDRIEITFHNQFPDHLFGTPQGLLTLSVTGIDWVIQVAVGAPDPDGSYNPFAWGPAP